MNKLLSSCLYTCDKETFNKLRLEAKGFNSNYNGNNIIKDDIFNVLKNYSRMKEQDLEILRYPTNDIDFCACTLVKNDIIFVYVNSKLVLSKQIFAAGHELYHIYCYIEGKNPDFSSTGSILNSNDLDDVAVEIEDKKANAFAGLILAPKEVILEQMEIYGINYKNINKKDVIVFMDIFGIPFKAMVLRLYESDIIDLRKADELLSTPQEEIDEIINITGRSKRWQKTNPDIIEFGSLEETIQESINLDLLTLDKIKEDQNLIETLKRNLS